MGKFYFKDNGRVVNAVLVWAYAQFGVTGQQWFGPVSGVLMLGVLWAFTATVLRAANMSVPRGLPLLIASMVTVLFLLGSPNTYKTFYWPAASVSHTLPPVLACAAAIPVLRATSRRGAAFALLAVFITGGVLGMLSEETSVVVLAVLCCALLLTSRLIQQGRRRHLRSCCAAGIVGVSLGTLILYTSPGSLHRRETKHANSMLDPHSLLASLRVFAYITFECLTTWQYLGAIAVGFLLGLLARHPLCRLSPGRNEALLAASSVCVLVVSGYLCTVITYPVFGNGVMGSTRLWNDYLLLYIFFLVFVGLLGARVWRGRARRNAPAVVIASVVCVLVCASLATSLGSLESDMAVRARSWDRQDHWMSARAAAGAQVLPYRRLPISKMTEPFAHDGRTKWPAACVARYYGVKRITRAAELP
ncbi:DUF6056 family protein [Streptomyces aureus]|uniref:DUF6056 family protein n=1 Tax=Streptomyces aureus TaxID=193461 RepID=A0ABV4SZ11_9ACTN